MFQRLKDLASLVSFMERHIENEANLTKKLQEAIVEDKLEHFMSWNGIAFHEAVVYAAEARRFIPFLTEEAEREGEILTPEQKFQIVKDDTQRQIMNTRIGQTGGAGSMSHRITETARRDFFLLIYKGFNEGY